MRDVAVVLSDCQGPAISWVLGQLPALQQRYDFKYFESWQKPGPLSSIPDEVLERCTLMFYQVSEGGNSAEVMAQLPGDCHLVRFGSPAYTAMYPRRARWPRDSEGRPRCGLHPEMADRNAIALIKAGLNKAEYVSEYFSRPVARDVSIKRLQEVDRIRLEQSDLETDIKTADYILSNIRSRRLFHCVDHPTNDLYMYQMRAMIDLCWRMGVPGFKDPQVLKAGLLDVERSGPASFGATEFMGEVQVPVHPEVIEALRLTYLDAATVYENRGVGNWTHRDYILAIHDHMAPCFASAHGGGR